MVVMLDAQAGPALPSERAAFQRLLLFSRAAWLPCVITWDPETSEFRRVEGPEGFTTWEEADEASGFLGRGHAKQHR
jgi:hypothetical protein